MESEWVRPTRKRLGIALAFSKQERYGLSREQAQKDFDEYESSLNRTDNTTTSTGGGF